MLTDRLHSLDRDGFVVVPAVYTATEAAAIAEELSAALATGGSSTMRGGTATVVAARNVLELYPRAATIWRRGPLVELLAEVLGARFGLVRVLFFDKPPERTWALAWHKDLTVAVRDHSLPSQQFCKPTLKAGVRHVEAPCALLERMLTLRIHLDDVTDENGPLRVVPGSQRSGKEVVAVAAEPAVIHARGGDVLAMRPLLSHSSGASHPGTRRHRRVLHLEFAGCEQLADGFQWHDFIR